MFSDRIGQQISHACEWELREMAAYMGAVLNLGRADEDRNPLRADVLGMAIFRAIEAVTSDTDGRNCWPASSARRWPRRCRSATATSCARCKTAT